MNNLRSNCIDGVVITGTINFKVTGRLKEFFDNLDTIEEEYVYLDDYSFKSLAKVCCVNKKEDEIYYRKELEIGNKLMYVEHTIRNLYKQYND